jgi:histidine ammonia-lyase
MELPEHISIEFFNTLSSEPLTISQAAAKRISTNRSYLDNVLKNGKTHYGINTGFGFLCNVRIDEGELSLLQENLVCSHACGMGNEVPVEADAVAKGTRS